MTDAIDLTAPTTPAETPAETLTLSRADLQQMINDAVTAGAASAAGTSPLGAPAVNAEAPEEWTVNEFMRQLVAHTRFYTEREERAAYWAVNKHFPVPADGDS